MGVDLADLKGAIALRPGQHRRNKKQIDACILALVLNGGSISDTALEYGESPAAIREWRRRYPARYAELQQEYGPEIERRAVAELQAFITRAERAKGLALSRTVDLMEADARDEASHQELVDSGALGDDEIKPPTMRVRNTHAALKDIAIAQGISVQKVLELTNRPTQVIEHRSPAEAMAQLRALGALVIDGTADVLPSGEVNASAPVAELTRGGSADGNRDDHPSHT